MTYKSKLLDPRWQRRRLETFERDGWMCVRCGDGGSTLHCHHVWYAGEPWEAPPEALWTVCDVCHKVLHERKVLVKALRPWNELRGRGGAVRRRFTFQHGVRRCTSVWMFEVEGTKHPVAFGWSDCSGCAKRISGVLVDIGVDIALYCPGDSVWLPRVDIKAGWEGNGGSGHE